MNFMAGFIGSSAGSSVFQATQDFATIAALAELLVEDGQDDIAEDLIRDYVKSVIDESYVRGYQNGQDEPSTKKWVYGHPGQIDIGQEIQNALGAGLASDIDRLILGK